MTTSREMRLCFESELAELILKNAHYFSSTIEKVSASIINLLNHPTNIQFLSENIILNDEMLQQLYSNTHYGVLGKALNFCFSQPIFLQKMINACQTKQSELPIIIHLHQIFMQYIYDKLPFKSEDPERVILKDKLVEKIFIHSELFKKPRVKINPNAGALTTQIGIAGDIECSNKAETEIHQNVLGMFSPNAGSYWGKFIEKEGLPFVAGPSGHTGSSILLGTCVAALSPDQLKEYLSCVLAVLVAGGYHTMDEVIAVINLTGIPYQPGKPYLFLPKEFLCSAEILELSNRYPTFLNRTELCEFVESNVSTSLYEIGKAAGHGFIRGASNLIEMAAINQRFSQQSAYVLKQLAYYLSFLGMKYTEHYLLSDDEALSLSLVDTNQLFIINSLVEEFVLLLSNSRETQEQIENILSLGIYGYSTYQQPISAAIYLTTSYASQRITEEIGKWLFFRSSPSHPAPKEEANVPAAYRRPAFK